MWRRKKKPSVFDIIDKYMEELEPLLSDFEEAFGEMLKRLEADGFFDVFDEKLDGEEKFEYEGHEPLLDVIEHEDCYEVVVELPGVEKDEIRLNATEKTLEIMTTGDRKFCKEINFRKPINVRNAKATFRNGILSVKLEKKKRLFRL